MRNAIYHINQCVECEFVMINGDLTEYGHGDEYFEFTKEIKDSIKKPLFYGVGNHDIENNLGDCQDGITLGASKDSCAMQMWARIVKDHDIFKKKSPYPMWVSKIVDLYTGIRSTGAFQINFDDKILLWQLQNRYFQFHVFTSLFGGILGSIEPSLIEVYNAMINYPKHIHILSSHYSEKDCESVDIHMQYVCKFVLEKNKHKILARIQGHTHYSSISDNLIISGALFNSEFDKITLNTDTCEISVDSFKDNQYTYKGTVLSNNCPSPYHIYEQQNDQPLNYQTLVHSDVKNINTSDAIVLKMNFSFNESYISLPIPYYDEKLKQISEQYYRFEFNCTLQALNYQTTKQNRIAGRLFLFSENDKNPSNINTNTGEEATVSFIPNSNIQILNVNNKTEFLYTKQPIIELFNYESKTKTFKITNKLAFYVCL